MATIALAMALDHLHAGRREQADTLDTRILDADPGNAEALHRLGLPAGRPAGAATASGGCGPAATTSGSCPGATRTTRSSSASAASG